MQRRNNSSANAAIAAEKSPAQMVASLLLDGPQSGEERIMPIRRILFSLVLASAVPAEAAKKVIVKVSPDRLRAVQDKWRQVTQPLVDRGFITDQRRNTPAINKRLEKLAAMETVEEL